MKQKVINLIIITLANFFTSLKDVVYVDMTPAPEVTSEPVDVVATLNQPLAPLPGTPQALTPEITETFLPEQTIVPQHMTQAPQERVSGHVVTKLSQQTPEAHQQQAVAAGPSALPATPVSQGPAQPVTAAAAGQSVALDSEGFPWDARVHSSGRTQYKSRPANGSKAGEWIWKKGVKKAFMDQVKAEFSAGSGAPDVNLSTVQPAQLQTAQPAAPTAPYGSIHTWGELMRNVAASHLDKQAVDLICQKYGIGSMAELQNAPTYIPAIAYEIGLTLPPAAQ